jgi:hypothetical protein
VLEPLEHSFPKEVTCFSACPIRLKANDKDYKVQWLLTSTLQGSLTLCFWWPPVWSAAASAAAGQ